MYLPANFCSLSFSFGESTVTYATLDEYNWYYTDVCCECPLCGHATQNAVFLFDF